MEKAQNKKW